MKRGILMKISLMSALLVAALVIFSATQSPEKNATTPSKAESEADCFGKKGGGGSGEMIWESLPRQFISSINVIR